MKRSLFPDIWYHSSIIETVLFEFTTKWSIVTCLAQGLLLLSSGLIASTFSRASKWDIVTNLVEFTGVHMLPYRALSCYRSGATLPSETEQAIHLALS